MRETHSVQSKMMRLHALQPNLASEKLNNEFQAFHQANINIPTISTHFKYLESLPKIL